MTKKIITITGIFLVLSIVSLFIWLLLPCEETMLTQLIPDEAFAFVRVKINKKLIQAVDKVIEEEWLQAFGVKIKHWPIIKNISRIFLPTELAICIISKSKPEYIIMVKNAKIAKLAGVLKALSKYKYTVFKDTVIKSDSPSLIKASLNQYGKKNNFLYGKVGDYFWHEQRKERIIAIITNRYDKASAFIKHLEKRYSYVIFPSIDSIIWIGGHFGILDSKTAEGRLIFNFREDADVEEVNNSIWFLKEILRRLCKAEGLDFSSEIDAHKDYLSLDFEIRK